MHVSAYEIIFIAIYTLYSTFNGRIYMYKQIGTSIIAQAGDRFELHCCLPVYDRKGINSEP